MGLVERERKRERERGRVTAALLLQGERERGERDITNGG